MVATELPTLSASMSRGVRRAKLADVAHTPTQRGVMALTLSALARRASASAAHWMLFAAISFASAKATRPIYSDPIVIDAVKAAAAGAKTSVTLVPGKAIGPIPLASTAPSNNPTSVPESCGCNEAKLSSSAMSFSRVASAVVMRVGSFLELMLLLLLLFESLWVLSPVPSSIPSGLISSGVVASSAVAVTPTPLLEILDEGSAATSRVMYRPSSSSDPPQML
mmetsp:Transcript_3387/g.7582  ORF Transcript_3387/g.7582 Transcript_3387/m.7582 type:complete len:223 (-) Transcript_3387:6-674(-)